MGFGVRGQGRLGVGVWCQGSGEGRLGVGVLGQALRHAGVAEAFCRAFCQAGLAPFMAPAAMQLAGIPCVHLMHEQARPGPAACMHGAAGVSPPCWAPARRVCAARPPKATPRPSGCTCVQASMPHWWQMPGAEWMSPMPARHGLPRATFDPPLLPLGDGGEIVNQHAIA